MTDDKYTPSTEEVRYVYGHGVAGLGDEFDRWLKGVRAEAWEEGCNEAHLAHRNGLSGYWINPYRDEKTND